MFVYYGHQQFAQEVSAKTLVCPEITQIIQGHFPEQAFTILRLLFAASLGNYPLPKRAWKRREVDFQGAEKHVLDPLRNARGPLPDWVEEGSDIPRNSSHTGLPQVHLTQLWECPPHPH